MFSRSPISITCHDEFQKILHYDVLFLRHLPQDEMYVDFTRTPVKLLGYIICE